MADDTKDTKPNTPPPDDAAYWRDEAKKIIAQRDDLKARMRDLESRALPEDKLRHYQDLEAQAAKLEEERRLKAGEFEAARKDIETKHAREREALAKEKSDLESALNDTLVSNAFASAVDWFGGDGAKTVLTPEIATAWLGKYVKVKIEDGHRTLVVNGRDGQPLTARNGSDLPFADAIGELIGSLPERDRILRGSGKVGSGSPGGTTTTPKPIDLDALLERVKAGDPEAIKQLQARQNALGGIQSGRAWQPR